MKTIVFAAFFFFATEALGQTTGGAALLNSEPVVTQFASHDARASQQPMGMERNLLGVSAVTSARGERPLWEFASAVALIPLGDSARDLKKAHEVAKRANIVWTN